MRSLAVCLIILCSPAYAEIGSVTEQLNSVPVIQRQNQTLQAPTGTKVEMMDAVRTTQGKIGITFEDKSRVQVNENSKLVIDDFVYSPKNKAGQAAMKVAYGTVRFASGDIAHNNKDKVAINTPSASISVRGTDFTATVDETGASTVVLLPTCPGWRGSRTATDIEPDCTVGAITVSNDAGSVVLNKPFQATRVENRSVQPSPPVILKLSEFAMNNMLIVAPPRELEAKQDDNRKEMKGILDVNFLKETGLANALDAEQKDMFVDKLSRNFLDQDFLANVLDIINAQMAAQVNLLNSTKSGLLPDYNAVTGVVAEVDDTSVTLSRSDGSNRQSITTPKNQNSTLVQTQGSIEVKNRVNNGGGTTITVVQDNSAIVTAPRK